MNIPKIVFKTNILMTEKQMCVYEARLKTLFLLMYLVFEPTRTLNIIFYVQYP